jgi:hypothetical protein
VCRSESATEYTWAMACRSVVELAWVLARACRSDRACTSALPLVLGRG